MTLPIESGSDSSKVESSTTDPSVEAAYNPYLAALLAGDISVSTAEGSTPITESGSPKLPIPSTTDNYYRKMQLSLGAIMSKMLDAWNQNIDENAKTSKENQKEVDVIKEHEKKVELDTLKTRSEIKRKQTPISVVDAGGDIWRAGVSSILALYVDGVQKTSATAADGDPKIRAVGGVQATDSSHLTSKDLSGHHPSSAMTSALIIASGFVGTFKTSEAPGAVQMDNKMLQDAWNQIAGAHNPNDPATQVAGWVSALWGIGLTYFTAAKEVGEIEAGKKEPAKDLEFAVKYAENLLAGLASGQFMAHIKAIVVSNTQPGEKADQQHVDKLCNMGKVVLLTVALAQIMKLEYSASYKEKKYEGHLTGDDVEAMLQGKINFQTNDPHGLAVVKAKLIMQINHLMVMLPETDRAALMMNMKAYFNKNPSIEKLSDANSVVGAVFSGHGLDEKHLGQNRM